MLSNLKKHTLIRLFLIILGLISLFSGIVGIFIPLLPTTPLLLLSAWCFFHSSPRLYGWIMKNHLLGKYIGNYREGRGVSLQIKLITLILLWVTILYSTIIIINNPYLKALLFLILLGVTLHLYLIPNSPD